MNFNCPRCSTEVTKKYTYCPECGSAIFQGKRNEMNSSISLNSNRIIYSKVIKRTVIWSVSISLITILMYMIAGKNTVDLTAVLLINGFLTYPISTFLLAFIYSLFFKKGEKAASFDSASYGIMILITLMLAVSWIGSII